MIASTVLIKVWKSDFRVLDYSSVNRPSAETGDRDLANERQSDRLIAEHDLNPTSCGKGVEKMRL